MGLENLELVSQMRGESCFTYFRECEYFNTCTLSTENLITPPPPQEAIDEELAKFQIHVTLDDLIQSQLSKNAEPVLPTQGDEIL